MCCVLGVICDILWQKFRIRASGGDISHSLVVRDDVRGPINVTEFGNHRRSQSLGDRGRHRTVGINYRAGAVSIAAHGSEKANCCREQWRQIQG